MSIHRVLGQPSFDGLTTVVGTIQEHDLSRLSFLLRALELEACVCSQREDHGIARRANAILLLDDGKSCQLIAEFLCLDDVTIRGWYKSYRESGWDGLAFDGWKGGQSRMTSAQEAALCTWLEGLFCHSMVEIRSHIASEFCLQYSHSGGIKLLARLGFKYRKSKALPRVTSAEKQAALSRSTNS